jgi:hypothetical protein
MSTYRKQMAVSLSEIVGRLCETAMASDTDALQPDVRWKRRDIY